MIRQDPAAAAGSWRQAPAGLCVTEIVSYGVMYYAFPMLASQIAACPCSAGRAAS